MAAYRLSKAADRKLTAIYEYSLLNFGEAQADQHLMALHDCFDLLVSQPEMGRIFREYHRHEHGRYVIFYKSEPTGIWIAQILHQSEEIEGKLG